MPINVARLYRHPVKGLRAESLPAVTLTENRAFPLDRLFAITHGSSQFNHHDPAWIARRNFAVVAHSAQLAAVNCQYDYLNGSLTLTNATGVIGNVLINQPDTNTRLNTILNTHVACEQPGPYRLVQAPGTSLTDSPSQTISIMNLQSLAQLETAVGQPLDAERFRGNLWLDGMDAWQENDWLNRELTIGDVSLVVTETIERCAAVNVKPGTGDRDPKVLRTLNQKFGHNVFGVLAQVKTGGKISVGDTLRVN